MKGKREQVLQEVSHRTADLSVKQRPGDIFKTAKVEDE